MRRILAVAGILGMVSLAAPTNAHALTQGSPLCIVWSGWSACASVQVAGNTVSMTVHQAGDASGANSNFKLTGFGFYDLAASTTTPNSMVLTNFRSTQCDETVPVLTSEDPCAWTGGTTLAGAGLSGPAPNATWYALATSNSGGTPPAIGSSYVLKFDVSGVLVDWATVEWAWRGQAWAESDGTKIGSGSIKCYSTGQASSQDSDNATVDATCGPTTVIPEPGSMVLLATGLIGLGGMGFIRRRKQA